MTDDREDNDSRRQTDLGDRDLEGRDLKGAALWNQCTSAVSRLESQLAIPVGPDCCQRAAEDCVAAITPISQLDVGYTGWNRPADPPHPEPSGDERLVASAGNRHPTDVDFQCHAPVTADSQLTVRVYFATAAGDEETSVEARNAIEETATAICHLLVGAVARVDLARIQTTLDQLESTAATLSDELDDKESFHRIANELAVWWNADRVSLLRRDAGRYEFVGSSVRPDVDQRAQQVAQVQAVAKSIDARLGTDADQVLIPKDDIAGPVATYAEQAHCNQIFAMRLSGGSIIAIAEFFTDGPLSPATLTTVRRKLVDNALSMSLKKRGLPLRARLRQRWAGTAKKGWLAAAVLLALAAFLVPLPISVATNGRVIPRVQHVVYAPITGQLQRYGCKPGERVERDQVLCEFSSHELQQQLARLEGERLTLEEQIEIASTRRGDDAATEIASDRRVLEVRHRETQKQIRLLRERQSQLVVRSPIAGIASLVVADATGSDSVPRPVDVGQAVIRVISPEDGYDVELEIADQEIGYVIDALGRQAENPVTVQYRIRSEPERSRSGILQRVDQTARLNRFGQLVVPAKVRPTDAKESFATDASVVAKVQCNRASAGFVLCRKLIEQLRLWGWL